MNKAITEAMTDSEKIAALCEALDKLEAAASILITRKGPDPWQDGVTNAFLCHIEDVEELRPRVIEARATLARVKEKQHD